MAKKAVKTASPTSATEELDQEIRAAGIDTSILTKIHNAADMDVTCLSTGIPSLDQILHRTKHGLPLGREVEIYSRNPEVGKTSLALQIGAYWQLVHKRRVAIVDVERTITTDFLAEFGFVVDDVDPEIPAVHLAKPAEVMTAELVLDLVRSLSNVFDLVIVDSIGGLIAKAEMEKDADENAKVASIASLLSVGLKKQVAKRATIIWINQMRQSPGAYSPQGGIVYTTMGGRALPFFASIRLELSMKQVLKDGDKEAYGMKVIVRGAKNKISRPFQECELTFLFGEGFSQIWDYLELGIEMKIVEKSGTWLSFESERIGQGMMNAYEFLKLHKDVFARLKLAIDGESVEEPTAVEAVA